MLFRRKSKKRQRTEARAPGRIDVLGGVARHQGGMVLEAPIDPEARVTAEEIEGHSVVLQREGDDDVAVDFRPFQEALRRKAERSEMRGLLRRTDLPEWAGISLACLLIFCETRVWVFGDGLRLSIESKIPGDGETGANEAMEIALLLALEKIAGRQFLTTEAARIAQQAESDLLGLPKALADKMAPAYGCPGMLLPILCQPERLYPAAPLPGDLVLAVWPGEEASSQRRRACIKARSAAFMGWKWFEDSLIRAWHHPADIPLELFRRHAAESIPERVTGAEFSERFGSDVPFPLQIHPEEMYEVNAALRVPLEEHERCSRAVSLLRELGDDNREEALRMFGDYIIASHEGYRAVGLGSAAADRRVESLLALGPDRGVYGARLCGEGLAGTVMALVTREALSEIGAPVSGTAHRSGRSLQETG